MAAFKIFRKFADLLDRSTVDLPAINTPLADALAAKSASADLADVATSGSYADLSGTPTVPTTVAELTDRTTYDFATLNTPLADALAGKATAAQGALADTAVQEGDSPSFVDVDATGTVSAAGLVVADPSNTDRLITVAHDGSVARIASQTPGGAGLPLALTSYFAGAGGSSTSLTLDRKGSFSRFEFYTDQTSLALDFTKFNFTSIASSGVANFFSLAPTVNQSGSASCGVFKVSPYIQSEGSGGTLLFDIGTNSASGGGGTHTSLVSIDTSGNLTASGTVTAAGATFEGNVLVQTTNSSAFVIKNAGGNQFLTVNTGTGDVSLNTLGGEAKIGSGSGARFNARSLTSTKIAARISGVPAQSADILQVNTVDQYAGGNAFIVKATGNVGIGTTTPSEKLDVDGNIKASGTVTTGAYTVATLPTPSTGMRCYVTDSNVAASGNFGATVAAGGANTVPVFYDGTNWIIA